MNQLFTIFFSQFNENEIKLNFTLTHLRETKETIKWTVLNHVILDICKTFIKVRVLRKFLREIQDVFNHIFFTKDTKIKEYYL